MRALWGVLLISGCAAPMRTVETFSSERMALATLPSAPLAVSGSPGISLAGRLLTGAPQAQKAGGGVAFANVQPELGGLVQLGERTWVGGHFNFVTGAFGVLAPPSGVRVPQSAVAFDLGVGAGHDLHVGEHWGFTLSAELGLAGTSLTSVSRLGTFTQHLMHPSARAALGVYATPGPVRLFVAGSASTGVWNDPTSTITQDCFTTCTVSDSGNVGITAIGMVGTGGRWQVNRFFSVALELWVPFTSQATVLPPMLSLALRAGDFVVRPAEPRVAPLSAPPPPPPVLLPPTETPPQL